ncbi:hypothetical protein DSO57_1032260 [Entomophthora muscae]|uniref:Uncharacterized protein n=1 Tax=Entomophthora muscae TaxID=34485 RepID=A0ACC2TMH1_9FUNG|nr:hypothetical protein DSO57_1032260 [Entomophthora muscae]
MPFDNFFKQILKLKGLNFLLEAFLIVKGLVLFLLAASLCLYGAPAQILTFVFCLWSYPAYHYCQSDLLDMQYCFMQFTFEKIQGARITYSGDKIDFEESAVVFSNHQSSADLFMIGALSNKVSMAGRSRYFMKDSIKYIPIFGWGLWMTGQFFLKRNWSEDKGLINRTFERIIRFKLPVWVISYPEGTRLSPEKKKRVSGVLGLSRLTTLRERSLPSLKGPGCYDPGV